MKDCPRCGLWGAASAPHYCANGVMREGTPVVNHCRVLLALSALCWIAAYFLLRS